jgi:hypothetical protein
MSGRQPKRPLVQSWARPKRGPRTSRALERVWSRNGRSCGRGRSRLAFALQCAKDTVALRFVPAARHTLHKMPIVLNSYDFEIAVLLMRVQWHLQAPKRRKKPPIFCPSRRARAPRELAGSSAGSLGSVPPAGLAAARERGARPGRAPQNAPKHVPP